MDRIIIVEGVADKRLVEQVLLEDIEVICTYGTFGIEKFDEMLEGYDLYNHDVYIFVDADDSGRKLRKQLTAELPNAYQLYIPDEFQEVERAPENIVAKILAANHFDVKPIYLML